MPINDIIHYAIFGLLTLVTVGGALKVVSTRSMIHAAFWLFPVFAGMAGFYLLLSAQFLAAIQVLIYIGAILVLIIFAVTLTRNAADSDAQQTNRFAYPVAFAALVLLLAIVGAAVVTSWGPVTADLAGITVVPGVAVTDVAGLGLVLLQQYLLPFEIVSVLLLAAMIGALVLARKERTTDEPVDTETTPAADAEARELANV